jgi:tetratricopeptide (TPR) repeat protein
MTKNTTHATLAILLLTSLVAFAQDEEQIDGGAIDAEVFGPEFVDPGEQTVPVADGVADESALTEEAPVLPREEALRGVEYDPDATPEERLLAEFSRYRKLLQEDTLDEADSAAKKIVELAIQVYGPQSRETANALNNLGIVQHGSGQYDAAIQNFTSSIEILEAVEDRLNGALVNPLKGLGAAQLGNGRPDQANKTFTRAAHITQVNEGPHNLRQVEILESIAEVNIRMGNTKGARNTLDRIHIINVKHFEKNPLGLLPSLMNRAEWQHRAGYIAEERTTYRRAIRIIESSSGKNDPLLVEPLRRLGQSYFYVDLSMPSPKQHGLISSGEIYLKRAARIADKSEDMDWRVRSAATIALADYYTFRDSVNRSRKIYQDVWDTLSVDGEKIAARDLLFRDPQPLRVDPLPVHAGGPPRAGTSPGELIKGKIVVDYSVSASGRVRDLSTEAFPQEFSDMQRMVHREIRSRIYRPRIVDGVAVDAEGLRYEHVFTYLQVDLDSIRKARQATNASAAKDDGS